VRIPLAAPEVTDADIEEVVRVLRSGRLSLGPRLAAFEGACAAYLGVEDAVAVNSGTSGLHLCLLALGIGEGDEVVTPSFSFAASATCLLQVGAVPVFTDIDPDTLCLDPERIEEAITPRTRAILVVHVFGRPAPMAAIGRIAARHGLRVIEDACEAFGATTGGRRVGTIGDAGVFAFYPNKQITTAEGGLIVARDPAIAARVRRLRNQGRDPSAGWFDHVELGYSYRLSELHCALGLSQLQRIEGILERRESIAREYDRQLSRVPGLVLPAHAAPEDRPSWLTYVLRLGDAFSREDRDNVLAEMGSRGIECGRYFAPIHLQPLFRGRPRNGDLRLPVSERVADRALALPFFHGITAAQVEEVCDNLASLVAARAARRGR